MHYLRHDGTMCGGESAAVTTLAAFIAAPGACRTCIDAALASCTLTLRQWCEMPATASLRRF